MSQLELFSPLKGKQSPLSANALPAYQVRESKRAKRVSIKISVEGGVEVVVPPKFDQRGLPALLEKKRDWIVQTRSRLLDTAETTADDWQVEKPQTIVFRWRSTSLDGSDTAGSSRDPDLDIWSVSYQSSDQGRKTLCIPSAGNRLQLQGNTEHLPNCQGVLKKWLAHQAHKDLAPWLRQLGFDLGLPCRRISVRGQKTRWASCSSRKDISLNYKLLFLPRPLVHYVLVHELSHTVHMNHSAKFWALVGEKQPDYPQWRDRLKTGWRYVPRWAES